MAITKARAVPSKQNSDLLYTDTKFVESVSEFINTRPTSRVPRSVRFKGKYLEVYLRDEERVIEGERMSTITVARVEVKEKYRGGGVYRALLKLLRNNKPGKVLVIESVLNEAQFPLYEKFGMERVPNSYPACFFMNEIQEWDWKLDQHIRNCAPEPVPKPVTREVLISMSPDTFHALARAAKITGFRSVAEFMLDRSGANVVDAARVNILCDYAAAEVRARHHNGETAPFTFRTLLPKNQRDLDNAPTLRDAEKRFRVTQFQFGIELSAKYPNRYSFTKTRGAK
jgi:hypothetical protein